MRQTKTTYKHLQRGNTGTTASTQNHVAHFSIRPTLVCNGWFALPPHTGTKRFQQLLGWRAGGGWDVG